MSADGFNQSLRGAVRAAFEELGPEVSGAIKEAISVPVEYVKGPRGGYRIIRSAPGEPPRMETGELRASVQHEVSDDGMTLTVFSEIPYAAKLETGFSTTLPRPIWRKTALDYENVALATISQKVREAFR